MSPQWPQEEIEARLTSSKYGSFAWFLARFVRDNFSTIISLGTDYGMHELPFTTLQKPQTYLFMSRTTMRKKILEKVITALSVNKYISFIDHLSSTILCSLQSGLTLVLINTNTISQEIYKKLLENGVFPGHVVLYGSKKTLAVPKPDPLHSWWTCDVPDGHKFCLSTAAIGVPLFPASGQLQ